MPTSKSNSVISGFTLVELLIVVIILAVLAAIVVPQFAVTTDDADESALGTNLSNIRTAIDLYYQQHGHYPSATAASGGTCAGTASVAAVDTVQAFIDQLSLYSDATGKSCSTRSDGSTDVYIYGPYLKKNTLPVNGVTGFSDLSIVTAGDLNLTGSAAGTANKGWKFDNSSGKFIADHVDYDHL